MGGALVELWGLAVALCLMVGIVYGFLRLLAWPVLAWARRRLRRQVLVHDLDVQDQLWVAGQPAGTYGRYPPAC